MGFENIQNQEINTSVPKALEIRDKTVYNSFNSTKPDSYENYKQICITVGVVLNECIFCDLL